MTHRHHKIMLRFIRGAIKHPGSLRRWAKKHGFIRKDGTIDLEAARKYASHKGLKHRIREINLARTLGRLRA